MNTIGHLLKSKGNDILSVEPNATVFEALQIMSENNVGALLVIHKGKLVGVFSERDYARKIILKGKQSKDTSVSELMTKEVLYINPQSTIQDCLVVMSTKHIRHMPVLEEEKLIGIVTIGDIVKQIISEQKTTIQELEQYITGTY